MSPNRKFLTLVSALELLFLLLCVVPIPNDLNPLDTTRFLSLMAITFTLFISSLYGMWLTNRGYMLKEVSLCLMLMPILHLVAAGAQDYLIWLPITLGCGSLAIVIPLAWQNS